MRTTLPLRNLVLTALLALLRMTANAQPAVTNGLLEKGFYMGYITSADRSSLAYYEPAPSGKFNFVILNLKDFSQRRMEALNVLALPTPDMKGQYWVEILKSTNYDETKPNYRLHYSADGSVANKIVYEGTWYPFGFTADGKAIAADVSFKDVVDLMSAKNLRIVDPATGTEVKSLIPGPLLTLAESQVGAWGGQKYFWHAHAGKGVLARVNKQTGDTKLFHFNGKSPSTYKTDFFISKLADTLLLGGSMYNAATGSGQLKAYGLISGKKLLDTQYNYRTFAAGWTFADGRLYAIHENTKGLTEYALTGKQLKSVKVHPLDLSPITFFSSTDDYQALVVSKATNRVALLPKWMAIDDRIPVNEAYIWELSTGKFLHKISNFYTIAKIRPPVAAYNRDKAIADEKAYFARVAAEAAAKAAAGPCGEAKAQLRVKVGSWVREEKGTRVIQLIDYDCKTMRYTGEMRFATQKALSTTTYPINLFDVSSNNGTPKYKVVSVRTCSKCDGAGIISGTRNYEKVDYGIYNKYTTTGTISFTDLCKECKGDGMLGY